MTQNQIAFQKTKLEEEANRIKDFEAKTKAKDFESQAKQRDIKNLSDWNLMVHEYGSGLQKLGEDKRSWFDRNLTGYDSKKWKNIFDAASGTVKALFGLK